MMIKKLFPIFLLIIFPLLYSCKINNIEVEKTNIALGTFIQINIVCNKKNYYNAEKTINNAFKLIKRLENEFDYRKKGGLNNFNIYSILYKNNSPELFSLIVDSVKIAKLTDGYFDPTIYPLTKLWGFNGDNPHLPEQSDIDKAKRLVNYKKLDIKKQTITKPNLIKLDLSAIAKGKIVDLTRDFIIKNGYKNFLINAGGDIYASGLNKENKRWKIAIQDPFNHSKYIGILNLKDSSVVTSGDYERFFIKNGIRYCHIINPKTGYPPHNINSVTIISKDTEFSDAIATAVFVMGIDRGFKFLVKNNIQGLIIGTDKNNKIIFKHTDRFWN